MDGKGFLAVSLGMVLFFSAAGSAHGNEFFRQKRHNRSWYDSVFTGKLIKASGREVDISQALQGKMVGVYFSASWCGPCRNFTPQLVKFYKRTAAKENLEIVFVSLDRTEADMMNYMKKYSMPWLAVPFNDPSGKKLKNELNIHGIPALVIFDSSGKKITSDARRDVVSRGNRAVKAWKSSEKDQTPAFQGRDRRRPESSSPEPIKSAKWLRGPSDQWHIRMNTALQYAQREQKKILVLLTASDWRKECRLLQSDILSHPEFLEFARDNLVLVYLDHPRSKPMPVSQENYNEALAEVLQLRTIFPATYILDEYGRKIGYIRGYIRRDQYMGNLRKILESGGWKKRRKVLPPDWIRKPPELLGPVMEQRRLEKEQNIMTVKEQASFQIEAWGLDENKVTRPFDPRQEICVYTGTKIYFKIRCRIPKGVKAHIYLEMPDAYISGAQRTVSGNCSVVSPVSYKTPSRQNKFILKMKLTAQGSPTIVAAELPCRIVWEEMTLYTR